MTSEPAWLDSVARAAGERIGLAEPLAFPEALIALFAVGVEAIALTDGEFVNGPLGGPHLELGLFGQDMVAYFDDYEFATYMPGAMPLGFDGGGGFFCLDLREVAAGRASDDGSAPVVWSHAGNLGWDDGEMTLVSADFASFLTATAAMPA